MFELPAKLELYKKKWTNLYKISPFTSVLINSKCPSVISRDYLIFFDLLISSQNEGVIPLPTKIPFIVFNLIEGVSRNKTFLNFY